MECLRPFLLIDAASNPRHDTLQGDGGDNTSIRHLAEQVLESVDVSGSLDLTQ